MDNPIWHIYKVRVMFNDNNLKHQDFIVYVVPDNPNIGTLQRSVVDKIEDAFGYQYMYAYSFEFLYGIFEDKLYNPRSYFFLGESLDG